MGQKFLGEFEELILISVLVLGENQAYGVPIAEKIENTSNKRVSIGALYTALGRLEEKGFLSSSVGESTEERGGRAKKYYTVKAEGLQILKEIHKARQQALNTASGGGEDWGLVPA